MQEQERDFIWNFLQTLTADLARSKLNYGTIKTSSFEEVELKRRVIKFQQICLNIYEPLSTAHKTFTRDELNLYLSSKVLKGFERAWKRIFPEKEFSNSQCFLEFKDCNDNVSKPHPSMVYDKLRNLQISLGSPTIIAEQSVMWMLRRKRIITPGAENLKVQIAMANDTRKFVPDCVTDMCLHEYRKFLITRIILNLLKLRGYSVDETQYFQLPYTKQFQNDLFLITESLLIKSPVVSKRDSDKINVIRMKIGNVTIQRQQPRTAENCETIGLLLNARVERSNIEQPEGCATSNSKAVANSLAMLNYELLVKSPSSEIVIKSEDPSLIQLVQTQEPTFINYTYARIVSILNKFSQRVIDGEYAHLPSEAGINFSLITKTKEELSLLDAIMEWPRIVHSIIDLSCGEIRISSALRFLNELAHRFKAFYGQHVVLLPPSAHDFQTMFARIYFLRAVLAVFQEGFELFDQYI